MSITLINKGTKINRTCSLDEIDKVIDKILSEIGDAASQTLEETNDYISKEALKVIKTNAPVGARHGKYKNHISRKQTKKTALENEYTIYVRPDEYRLSHLLEYGHAIAGGTRRTKAYPHFAKGQEYVLENYEKEFIRRFNNGNK